MAFIDSTVVNVALPALQTSLNATAVDMQWVIEAYSLLLSALLLVGGSLGDHYGRRRVFVIGVALFALASAACGFAADIRQLIAARALQGLGAALLVPGSLAIISSSFSEKERGRAIGTWSGFSAITTGIGPVIGGWLIEHVSWRAVFFINLPLALVVILISLRHIAENSDKENTRVDWLGAILAAVGLGALVYGLIESSRLGFTDRSVVVILIAAAVLIIVFLFVEARLSQPMLPLPLFRSRTFTGANLLTFLLYAALGGTLFFLPLNLIQVQQYLSHRCRRGSVALHLDHFFPFALVGRACCKIRAEASAHYRSVDRRVWLCAFYGARRGRQLLDKFFPTYRGSRVRHGGKRGSSYHDGDEFRCTEPCRRCIRRQQRDREVGWAPRHRGSWNRDAPCFQ